VLETSSNATVRDHRYSCRPSKSCPSLMGWGGGRRPQWFPATMLDLLKELRTGSLRWVVSISPGIPAAGRVILHSMPATICCDDRQPGMSQRLAGAAALRPPCVFCDSQFAAGEAGPCARIGPS